MEKDKSAIKTGMDWKCTICFYKQEPLEGEEWPEHCGKLMVPAVYWSIIKQKSNN